jgi:hypothetical protein
MIGNYFWGGAAAPYEIEQSLRFNSADNAYLSRTFGTGGSSVNFTISLWAKKASNDDNGFMLLSTSGAAGSGRDQFYINSAEKFQFYGSSQNNEDSNNVLLRDPSAWYHIVVACDMDNGTATDRIKVFYNGQRQASVSTSITSFSFFGGNRLHYIGTENDGVYNNGYIAEYHYVDGTTKDPTDFGEYDDNGVWRPIAYSGSYGTNGFYLKFDPTATNGVGHDHSGNGNNWTASGFTTSGTGTDVMSDTPTTNWCTLNPLGGTFQSRHTLSEGNLKYTQSANTGQAATMNSQGTIGVSSGKWYWEISNATNQVFGFMQSQNEAGTYQTTGGWVYSNGENHYGGVTGFSHSNSIGSSDVIGIALDMDNNTCATYKNGSLMGTFTTIPDGTYFPTAAVYSSSSSGGATYNFGQRAFAYTPPTGYKALNTANLPAPEIKDGSDYFNTVLYSGNGSTQSITGVGFQPDWVLIKDRVNSADNWNAFDVVRGATKVIRPNLTSAEATDANSLTSFDSDGFSLGTRLEVNRSTSTFASWNWLAGGSTSSNTDGSITSTVSANPSAGFSIVSYTGNVTAGATVGHGLGVAPEMIIVKNRDTSGYHWIVYHKDIGATKYLYLSGNFNAGTYTNYWNNTAPSSTVFTIGTDNAVNANGDDMIAYCFAEVEGYSKFGSYTGNGNASGPFVWCGFKPSFLMIKRTDSTGDWFIFDTARDTYNVSYKWLKPNTSGTEPTGTGDSWDILSNGFKPRNSNANQNGSGNTYAFMALAEHPFGGDGVSPATAR